MDEYIRKIVAEAPPLSIEQARTIATLLDVENQRAKARAERQPYNGDAPEGLSRRSSLSGTPEQSNGQVLQAYRKLWDTGLARTPLWPLWHPNPEDIFRWRIKFDCGCVEDRMTTTDDPQSLRDGSDNDWRTSERLPPGQYVCGRTDHPHHKFPVRNVASWDGRRGERDFAADPIEPPEWWGDAGAEKWMAYRKEPRTLANWAATLTCGHRFTTLMNLDWTPEQGLHETPPERLSEMRAEWADAYAPDPIPDEYARQLDAGWPQLYHYLDCDACKNVRAPVSYQPLGWLVPPPKPRKPRQQKTPNSVCERSSQRPNAKRSG
ncbi:hypothetical protein [Mycolicibacterium diernhoferi]|uniref:hypothetical protein n=1 Tax=Mycolicibacterium diernhoferi TaxID=1801 RepID=UPI000B030135|nr:hypothetical protein [Mycolicibacterium diernhoferi]QYL20731.1 hypothetical protein K0O62_16790 [Mycolicibacterium diernhoferi]